VKFEELLRSSDREEDVHQFLACNSWLISFSFFGDGFLLDSGTHSCSSKGRLGDSFVTDFLFLSSNLPLNDPRPMAHFIEIERPNLLLFTKAGDPTSGLTHAIRQVQDWRQWVDQNRAFLYRTFPFSCNDGVHDSFLVIAGRRDHMDVSKRLRLAQMNQDLNGIRIMTYDTILERAFIRATKD